MEWLIERKYYPTGTNGILYCDGREICATIELPWLNNEPKLSCIPEGRYNLSRRYSEKFKWHLLVEGVPGRSLILVHPANNAIKELRGCIAPVRVTTGAGKGTFSRMVFNKMMALIPAGLKPGEVILTVRQAVPDLSNKKSTDYETSDNKNAPTNAAVF